MNTISETTVATFNIHACIQVHRANGSTDEVIKSIITSTFALFKQDFICLIDPAPMDQVLVDDKALREEFDCHRKYGVSILCKKHRFEVRQVTCESSNAHCLSIFAIESLTKRCYSVGILLLQVENSKISESFVQLQQMRPLLTQKGLVELYQRSREKMNPLPRLPEDAWCGSQSSSKICNLKDFEKYCYETTKTMPLRFLFGQLAVTDSQTKLSAEQALSNRIGTHIVVGGFGRGSFFEHIFPYSSLYECHVAHIPSLPGKVVDGKLTEGAAPYIEEKDLSGRLLPREGLLGGVNPMVKVWDLLEPKPAEE